MEYKLKISDINFFNGLSPSYSKELAKAFKIIKVIKDEMILDFEDPVPGLFIIAEGSVDVYARDLEVLIATLETGSSFGEMSLLKNEKSSACLQASENSVLLLCEHDKFKQILADNFAFAAAFYKGAAEILSDRLRKTNLLIETEMHKGKKVIRNMLDDKGVIAKLGHTQGSLNDTGENMIAKLSNLLPTIEDLFGKSPKQDEGLLELKKTIKTVLTIDSQNFDIISQQMDQINQHMNNIQRLMQGIDMHDIKGDTKIFELIEERGTREHDEVTFF